MAPIDEAERAARKLAESSARAAKLFSQLGTDIAFPLAERLAELRERDKATPATRAASMLLRASFKEDIRVLAVNLAKMSGVLETTLLPLIEELVAAASGLVPVDN